jgi:hypothetical protein
VGPILVTSWRGTDPCAVWWRWCQWNHPSPWKGCLIFTQRSSSKATRCLFWWFSWTWITAVILKWNG